jgi:hypothetical protein
VKGTVVSFRAVPNDQVVAEVASTSADYTI